VKLIHFKLCPSSRAVRLLLGEFALRYELEEVRPWAIPSRVLALNPAASLPVLQRDDGTCLSGLIPILEFLGDAQTQGRALTSVLPAVAVDPDRSAANRALALFPGDLEDRAEVRRMVDWFAFKCDREVTQEFLYEKVRAALDPATAAAPNARLLRAARSNLRYHLSYLGFLADQRRWLAGDRITAADFVGAAHVSVIDFVGEVAWSETPHVQDWYQRMKSRPSFRTLLEDRVPGLAAPSHYRELDF